MLLFVPGVYLLTFMSLSWGRPNFFYYVWLRKSFVWFFIVNIKQRRLKCLLYSLFWFLKRKHTLYLDTGIISMFPLLCAAKWFPSTAFIFLSKWLAAAHSDHDRKPSECFPFRKKEINVHNKTEKQKKRNESHSRNSEISVLNQNMVNSHGQQSPW